VRSIPFGFVVDVMSEVLVLWSVVVVVVSMVCPFGLKASMVTSCCPCYEQTHQDRQPVEDHRQKSRITRWRPWRNAGSGIGVVGREFDRPVVRGQRVVASAEASVELIYRSGTEFVSAASLAG
jgi:hypothetical protein